MKEQEVKVRKIAALVAECGDMLDFVRVFSLAHHAWRAKALDGEFAEFGCYKGHTAALLAEISGRTVHLYDSFQGLPARQPVDGTNAWFAEGKLAASMAEVSNFFVRHQLRMPELHPGWFQDLTAEDLPEKLTFVHIDGDLYASILSALRVAWPNLLIGGTLIVDDYGWDQLPGVKAACDEFFAGKGQTLVPQHRANQVVVIKA